MQVKLFNEFPRADYAPVDQVAERAGRQLVEEKFESPHPARNWFRSDLDACVVDTEVQYSVSAELPGF